MRKSSARTPNYRATGSSNAERLANFRQQMADYARGQRLVELREDTHKSQESAALEIGVSSKSLRAWEHGGPIRWPNAKRVARFYGVDPESLVSREEVDAGLDGAEPLTQLDRIERQVSELHDLFCGEGPDAEEALAGFAGRVREILGLPETTAGEQSENPGEDERPETA